MRILIVSDSFKGSCSSLETGKNMKAGFEKVFPDADYRVFPIADGGEGTVEALLTAMGGRTVTETVTGPMGENVSAAYALLDNGTAVIEMAAASGLPLVPYDRRDPRVATTYGTGELIRSALDAGAKRIFIGIGGSATNDGGVGMAAALGVKFLNGEREELPFGGLALRNLDRIDVSGLDKRLENTEVVVACDVTNPLCGKMGASYVYGPQKGATPDMVRALDKALCVYGDKLNALAGRKVSEQPGAGAAGGLGAGLVAFCGGVLKPGIEEVMSMIGLEDEIRQADIVITGEGCVDKTSAYGKVFSGIGRTAKKYGVPVFGFAGKLKEGYEAVYDAGISSVIATPDSPMPMRVAMSEAPRLISAAAERTARVLKVGMEMGK